MLKEWNSSCYVDRGLYHNKKRLCNMLYNQIAGVAKKTTKSFKYE